jgi:hypothetical protein
LKKLKLKEEIDKLNRQEEDMLKILLNKDNNAFINK